MHTLFSHRPPGESIVVSYTISFPSGSTDDGSSDYKWGWDTSWVGYEGSIYVSQAKQSYRNNDF